MILADTSVWIAHFRDARLTPLLVADQVLVHSCVIGELALGRLGPRRRTILRDLRLLPASPVLRDHEVLDLVEARGLGGRGIGWVDAHLIASALVAGAGLWTLDRHLAAAAAALGVAAGPSASPGK